MLHRRCTYLLIGVLVFTVAAAADTVSLVSATTTLWVPGQVANTQPTSGTAAQIITNPVNVIPGQVWAAPQMGAAWISYDAGTGSPSTTATPNGSVYTFILPFVLPYGENTGSVTVYADDSTSFWVDDTKLWDIDTTPGTYCAQDPIGCWAGNTGKTFDLGLLNLTAGTHYLYFETMQEWGDGYGLMYYGSVDSVPEPASLLLFGGGLTALAAALRRRLRK